MFEVQLFKTVPPCCHRALTTFWSDPFSLIVPYSTEHLTGIQQFIKQKQSTIINTHTNNYHRFLDTEKVCCLGGSTKLGCNIEREGTPVTFAPYQCSPTAMDTVTLSPVFPVSWRLRKALRRVDEVAEAEGSQVPDKPRLHRLSKIKVKPCAGDVFHAGSTLFCIERWRARF